MRKGISASMATVALAASVMVMAGGVCSAKADIINIAGDTGNSTSNLGNFTGQIEYDFVSGNTGNVTFKLTNTSDPGNGGYITGFVFNMGVANTSAALSQTDYVNFTNLTGGGLSGAPFGTFMAGAALGGDFLGGGSPVTGVAVGDTGTLKFAVTSDFASSLSANDFINGPNDFNFIVRFRGFRNEGSDKVPGSPVPAPGAMSLLGAGALALTGGGRRRRGS